MKPLIASNVLYKTISVIITIFTFTFGSHVFGQDQKIADSLRLIYLKNTLPDTSVLELLKKLSFNEIRDLKKAQQYAEDLIQLAKLNNNKKFLRTGYYILGTKKRLRSETDQALDAFFKSAAMAREMNNLAGEGDSYIAIADIYSTAGNHNVSTAYYHKAISCLRIANDSINLASALLNAGDEFLKAKKFDTAFLYAVNAKMIFDKVNYPVGIGYSLGNLGMIYASTGRNSLGEKNLNEAIRILEANEDYNAVCDYLISMAEIYVDKGNNDEALHYALKSLNMARQYDLTQQIVDANLELADIYEREGAISKALSYYKAHIAGRDSISNVKVVQQMADLRTNYEVSQKQIEVDLLNQQKRNQSNILLLLVIILCLSVLVVASLLQNNKHRKKAYEVLNLQKQATDDQKQKAESALSALQSAQKQLIHSAKMASLGEVTSGIAHEIQNPLNFVNNFSEINLEMLDELKDKFLNKLEGSSSDDAKELIGDISNNLKKISEHGKRADGIVKGMLQHSSGIVGKKEQTDINMLADEALRLSYHFVKKKFPELNFFLETDFDQSTGKVAVVPQEIIRVFLNLFNNAFYATALKKKTIGDGFEPLVLVVTKRVDDRLFISIRDNGNGISQEIIDKIFQPFFTTKPTGEGIGLGLYLSYDIVKVHEGELTVESVEGDYTNFKIELPVC